MYKAKYISPMIPSFMLDKTMLFFKELLAFDLIMDTNHYVILQKDHLTIHILPAGSDIGQMEFYLEVDNLDVIWTFIKDKVDKIKHKEPFDRDYGMREIHLAVPGTNTLLFIGQEI